MQIEELNSIQKDLDWLRELMHLRLSGDNHGDGLPIPPPLDGRTHYSRYITLIGMSPPERLLLVLCIANYVDTNFLKNSVEAGISEDGVYPQLGFRQMKDTQAIVPTIETFLFLVAGNRTEERLETWHWLRNRSELYVQGIVRTTKLAAGDVPQYAILFMDLERMEEILFGSSAAPPFSLEFPAKNISTDLDWSDLVVNKSTEEQLNELRDWLQYRDALNGWEIARRIKPGYRALFYGPPGTGKTLAAGLLGKRTDKEVYLVDLSLVVSKYIGETEKNLANLFDRARNRNWILFFDEADALFGKRTQVRDAHDKYANQEVAYLLQKLEEFPGLVILASNLKSNMDEAFMRRFQSIIHFPMPGVHERKRIWVQAIKGLPIAEELDLDSVARNYELSGANIINALHYAALRICRTEEKLDTAILQQGIRKELIKEGKVL